MMLFARDPINLGGDKNNNDNVRFEYSILNSDNMEPSSERAHGGRDISEKRQAARAREMDF